MEMHHVIRSVTMAMMYVAEETNFDGCKKANFI